MSFTPGPKEAGTVPVRVQVIDVEAMALDLVVPSYLPARDLTQRIARDARLGAYWEDGSRRLFWLRARGRLLGDDERLQDLGVVAGELLHLLPQPPSGVGVIERRPEYPDNLGYSGSGWWMVLGSIVVLVAWVLAWGVAMSVNQSVLVNMPSAVGLALLSTAFVRHLLGGDGKNWQIPVLSFVVFAPLVLMSGFIAIGFVGAEDGGLGRVAIALGPAIMFGMFGVVLGWLAWYGAVEPLPQIKAEQEATDAAQAAPTVPCGICGGGVNVEVLADCKYRCGRQFHVGCYKAREAVAVGGACSVCGYAPQ